MENPDEIAIRAGQQARGHFDNGHLAPKRRVYRSQLEADVSAADHEQRFGNVRQIERRCRVEHARAVDRQPGHPRRL